jgi:hypothetical protein
MRAVISPLVAEGVDVDAAIETAIDRVIGDSFHAKPKQVCTLLNISMSTYVRGVKSGRLQPVRRGDYEALARPHLHALMKFGFASMTGKSAA